MQIQAVIKYVHISPKKIRETAHAVVGLKVKNAIDRLTFAGSKAAVLLAKAIKSAQANAVNNMKLNGDSLKIMRIEIGKGPFLKRWNPVSRGIAHSIKKRTSHITVVVEDIQSTKSIAAPKKEVEVKEENSKSEVKSEKFQPEADRPLDEKGQKEKLIEEKGRKK